MQDPQRYPLAPLASLHSTLVGAYSETGRIAGHLYRRQPYLLCQRFDWFCGMVPEGPRKERRAALLRFMGYVAAIYLAASFFYAYR